MKIVKDIVVSMAYQVKTEDGTIIDESTTNAPLVYLHGYQSLIPGLENSLTEHKVGDKFEVSVKAQDAYGEYADALIQRVPKEAFTGVDNIEVGMRFIADTDQGQVPVEITEVGEHDVVVDGNHPFAGKDLTFNIEILELREATEEEKQHGHIHGEHDHHDGCCGGNEHRHHSCDGHGGCGCH